MSPLHHDGRLVDLTPGKTLFDYAAGLKMRVPTSCRRNGECHECIVHIRQGMEALSEPTHAETFLRSPYRLACQATIVDASAAIEFVVLRRQPKILTDAVHRPVALDPLTLPHDGGVFFDGRRIGDYRGRLLGLAIDAGTTTVAMNLVDLETGATIYTASFENPQRFGGSDVMHRISYDGDLYRGELQKVMISSVNFEVGDMCRRLALHRRMIAEAVVVGNSTMRDMFFGLDVQPLGQRPYKSVTQTAVEAGLTPTTAVSATARDLGLRILPSANVYGGPLIGSHVGADVAADLLAIGMDEKDETVMLMDVGTNTEVVIGNRHRMLAASCPAGPAFEGGHVAYGMPGYDGAVEEVTIADGAVHCKTIGGAEPQGICGSGLVDLLAELRRSDKMNSLGVLANGATEFFFAPERGMSVSRREISALAQAKSANFCGQSILTREFGVGPEQAVDTYLAGGFANYIRVANAMAIGFIVSAPPEKIRKVGNAALEGATLMLVSRNMRETAETMVRRIGHVELETSPDFFDLFTEGCLFKPMRPPRP